MKFIKTPVKGMNDFLPSDMRLRDYVIGLIKDTYGSFGFTPIETPCVEHIENLSSKQGGENEKLIFKILKRGEKLNLSEVSSESDLVDSGLRYDLTVPLSRYYANNMNVLPAPFKALQIGDVWRADRPQKGRFRQFTQCDIDILGDESNMAEIELISATTTLLGKLDFTEFKVRINDRRILKAMALSCGFPEDALDKVFITLDKMDKIGLEGVKEELLKDGYSEESVSQYMSYFDGISDDLSCMVYGEQLEGFLEAGILERLQQVIDCVNAMKTSDFAIVFDPTLVRGMSYYTGTIFEIEMKEFHSSVAGGGRYDEMIGKYSNTKVPACGFSIGFERIITILKDRNYEVPSTKKKVAFLVEKKVAGEKLQEMFREAAALRMEGVSVSISVRNKNAKFQKEKLRAEGYEEFKEFYRD
ncbi:MAG: histidine--tRNA ligase [Lachnospiraceae bacterium]